MPDGEKDKNRDLNANEYYRQKNLLTTKNS